MKKTLTIAGSDSSGGAGIQADLKTFSAHGVFGMSVITAVTAQNTQGVFAVENISTEVLGKQIDAIFEDIEVDALKIGMVSQIETIKVIAEKVKQYHPKNIVLDPVMVSKSGYHLLEPMAKDALIKDLLPLATIVTPNIPEAEVITNMTIRTHEDMKKAAQLIFDMGPKNVLVKGGHLESDASDLLFDGRIFTFFNTERIETKNTHGTGCTLSASIASNLAKGHGIEKSVDLAKEYITMAIKNSFPIGKGVGPVHHFYSLYQKADMLDIKPETLTTISKLIPCIRTEKPLVYHITNFVTMNDCANIVLALGGSPIMAFDKAEVEEIVAFSSALVVNIGTLIENNMESILLAGKKANALNVPVILDPVGVGATKFRYESITTLLDHIQFSVIKGNMSEIKTIAGLQVDSKGVDSIADDNDAEKTAMDLAKKLNCVIAITGKVDIVSDGSSVYYIHNGHEMLSNVTGTGCMSTSLVATFCGVTKDYLLATIGGILTMGIAGEKAFHSLNDQEGIGTFRTQLIDSVYHMSENTILKDGDITLEKRRDEL